MISIDNSILENILYPLLVAIAVGFLFLFIPINLKEILATKIKSRPSGLCRGETQENTRRITHGDYKLRVPVVKADV